MALKEFLEDLLKAKTDEIRAENLAQPNRYCWIEDNAKWNSIGVSRPTLLIPVGTPGVCYFTPANSINLSAQGTPEVYTAKSGVMFLFAPGSWNIQVRLAGSSAVQQCFVALDVKDSQTAQLINLLQATAADSVDIVRWGGSTVGIVTFDSGTANEGQNAPAIRAAVTGRDSSAGAGSQNVAVEARTDTGVNGSALTLYGLKTTSSLVLHNLTNAVMALGVGTPDSLAASSVYPVVTEGRKSGFYTSLRGRRFTITGAVGATIAGAVGFTATTPSFLLVNGATNEGILRRAVFTILTPGTAASSLLIVKTDTADRFSAGGTTRTPVTFNNGNVVAATQARSLELPTATAEGGGTRMIWQEAGGILAGSRIVFEPEDGTIAAASGSLLFYLVNTTGAANYIYSLEYEDGNVQ